MGLKFEATNARKTTKKGKKRQKTMKKCENALKNDKTFILLIEDSRAMLAMTAFLVISTEAEGAMERSIQIRFLDSASLRSE